MFRNLFKKQEPVIHPEIKTKTNTEVKTTTEVKEPVTPTEVINPGNKEATPLMQPIKLNNGAEVPAILVSTTMEAAKQLLHDDTIAFYEMVEKCRDQSYTMWKDTEKKVKKYIIIHDMTCDVIKSAVRGNGLEMRLDSPLPNNNERESHSISLGSKNL